MAKISELFLEIAERAGIEITSEELKPVLLIDTQISDTIAGTIKKNIVSIGMATQLPVVKNAIIKEYGAGLMQSQEETLREMGVSEDEIKEITKETTIGKRIGAGLKKLAELKAKPDPNADASAQALKDQIAALNTQLNEIKNSHIPKAELEQYKSQHENERILSLKEKLILSQPWSDAYEDNDVKMGAFNAKLDKFLAENKLEMVRDGEKLKFIQKEGGADYFDDSNKLVTFDLITSRIMTEGKFIAVSSGGQGTKTVSGGPTDPTKGTQINSNNKALALLRKSQQDQGMVQ